MLPEVVDHVSLYLHRAQTPEKKTIKERYNGQVSNKIETSRLNSTTCPHSFTPPASMAQITHSDAVEITLEKLAYLASIRLRATIIAANRKTRHNNTVTSLQYGRRAIFVSGGVRFQDGGAVDLGKRGGGLSFIFFSFFSMSALALAYFLIWYTHRTTVLLSCSGLCDIRVLFMYDACQCAWCIAPIIFNNVSLCPLIVIPNMPGLLCPRVLNLSSRLASWMC